jgi:hypothetical protein
MHEVILIGLFAFVASVQMKTVAMDRHSSLPFVWSIEASTLEPACTYAALDIGCVLASAK